MKYAVEEVFRTEGVPEFTFVYPPNYNEILVDLRNPGKPVIIEGQSGTGKTTTVKKIIEQSISSSTFMYLSARKSNDIPQIMDVAEGSQQGLVIIDDFHRLDNEIQAQIANLVKIAAEEADPSTYPKIVIIGINKVGSELIYLVHDIAKRCGIHRIQPADEPTTKTLINKGEEKLNVKLFSPETIFSESRGDYWLSQMLCQTICLINGVTETSDVQKELNFSLADLRKRMALRLEHSYHEAVKAFCRGKRFRSTNDPYFKLLRAVGGQESSIVDVTMLANQNHEIMGSINNIKEKRLGILLESKPICERYFYYNSETKNFAIEDPALFYYLKHLEWEKLRQECGFKLEDKDFEFDFAISFAGENRELARMIASQLEILDFSIFFDEFYEANYLGKAWGSQFEDIFKNRARFIVAILDRYHREKIWPTFERDCFVPRIVEEAVIPIYLDDTPFPGIPKDIVGINFDPNEAGNLENRVTDEIVFKLMDRIESL
jgi:hypothetical protein